MSSGQLFVLPNQVPLSSAAGLLSGAKLYFYTTNSSSPLNVYQDRALTTPHANPVVADANGVFPAIWLGVSSLYRSVLKTSADVTLQTVDDQGPRSASDLSAPTLAGNNVFTGVNKISAAEVRLILDETDGGTDQRLWDIDIQGTVLKLRTRTNVDGTGVDFLTATRGSGTAITSVNLTQTWNYQGNEIASRQSGSFTATLTGMTSATTGTVKYRIVSGICYLYAEANITGTSNTTAMTLTGLPIACQPNTAAQHKAVAINLDDNGQGLIGEAFIDGQGGGSPGTITFGLYTTAAVANRIQGGGLFTNSGTKGLLNGFMMSYAL